MEPTGLIHRHVKENVQVLVHEHDRGWEELGWALVRVAPWIVHAEPSDGPGPVGLKRHPGVKRGLDGRVRSTDGL